MEVWDNEILTTKLKVLCGSVKSLKSLYKPVYGLVVFFVIGAFIINGLRDDTKSAIAKIDTNREKHTAEYRDLDHSFEKKLKQVENNINNTLFDIGKDLGRNEASHIEISSKLGRIEEKLDDIQQWMREHK